MSKDVKNKIINTSYNLFQTKGYDNVTINDICNACNITKTTFYRYISSKEDILTYFFNQINDELYDLVINIASADNYWQQIIYVFDLIIDRMQVFTKELYAQLFITNLKNNHGTFNEIDMVKSVVCILIKKAQENDQIHNQSNPEELYDLCSQICFGCGIKWCLNLIDDVRTEFIKSISLALLVDEKIKSV